MKIRSLLKLKAGIALCEVIGIETDPIGPTKLIGYEIVGPEGVIEQTYAALAEAQAAFDEITALALEMPYKKNVVRPGQ